MTDIKKDTWVNRLISKLKEPSTVLMIVFFSIGLYVKITTTDTIEYHNHHYKQTIVYDCDTLTSQDELPILATMKGV